MEQQRIEFLTQKCETYCCLMRRLRETDVSADREFQRMFNGFYRIRQRSASFYSCFYTCLEQQKNNPELTFSVVLSRLYEETGILTPSFSSKLLATVRPELPVWDRFVLQNLHLRAPYTYDKNRIRKTEQLYEKICDWYRTPEAEKKRLLFEQQFPDAPITDTKKIDFMLWSDRP